MNLSIYGLGNRHQRSWLAVDLGVSFGDEEHLPREGTPWRAEIQRQE